MSKDTPSLRLSAFWVNHEREFLPETHFLESETVRERQQTRLLEKDNNFREMFQYYCSSDELRNFWPIISDLPVITSHLLYNYYLKWTNAFYSYGNIISDFKWELHLILCLFSAIYWPQKIKMSKSWSAHDYFTIFDQTRSAELWIMLTEISYI